MLNLLCLGKKTALNASKRFTLRAIIATTSPFSMINIDAIFYIFKNFRMDSADPILPITTPIVKSSPTI